MRKIFLTGFAGVVLLAVLFRVTPFLLPLTVNDIRQKQFHSVKFYDRHGNLLQEVLSQNASRAVRVELERVSPYFLQAVIAAEDRHFYRHRGIDYGAVLRAIWQNLRSGRVVSGASTITLQLARLLNPKPRTLLNKIREAYTAFRLEAGLSKAKILEAYLNRLPMGGNLHGVESAARAYFGVAAADLNLAQATFLAAIPNSPTRLNPYHNRTAIKKRQAFILQRMAKLGMISSRRASDALKADLRLRPQNSSFLAPHFTFSLLQRLPEGVQTVQTTLDAELQKMVQEQIQLVLARLKDFHVTNAAAILVDNRSGEVLAYVGSADFFNPEIDGQVDGVRALRQPGSTLKPFLYLLAMEQGFNPTSLISDIATAYRMPTGIYSPQNYSENFHGPVRLREALANSLNVPAVRTLAKIGTANFLRRLREYGFDSLTREADYYGVGLALGDGEVTLYQLTRAYLCLARQGRFLPLREYIRLNGKAVVSVFAEKTLSTPQLNFLITNILSDPQARTVEFGFQSVLNLPFPCAVKTGTSFRFCDNWTVGYTRDYTLGVWVGNFDHIPMMKVSGVTGAGPLFRNIMLLLYDRKEEPGEFPRPEGLVRVQICPLSGKRPGPACPSVLEEWIPERDLARFRQEVCQMHRRAGQVTKTVLPNRFRKWAQQMGLAVESPPKSPQERFAIVNPRNGAVYHRLPDLDPRYQTIRFQLDCSHPEQEVAWYLNGQLIRRTRNEHTFLWQATPGQYRLKAKSLSSDALQDEVGFSVKE